MAIISANIPNPDINPQTGMSATTVPLIPSQPIVTPAPVVAPVVPPIVAIPAVTVIPITSTSTFKPDFTQVNPYSGVDANYVATVKQTFVPTDITPLNPVQVAALNNQLPSNIATSQDVTSLTTQQQALTGASKLSQVPTTVVTPQGQPSVVVPIVHPQLVSTSLGNTDRHVVLLNQPSPYIITKGLTLEQLEAGQVPGGAFDKGVNPKASAYDSYDLKVAPEVVTTKEIVPNLGGSADMSYISSHPYTYDPNTPIVVPWRDLLQKYYPNLDLDKINIVENDKMRTDYLPDGSVAGGAAAATSSSTKNKIEINPSLFYDQPVVTQVSTIAHELEHIVQSNTGINRITPIDNIKYQLASWEGGLKGDKWGANVYEEDANKKGNEVTSSLGAIFGQWQREPSHDWDIGGKYYQGVKTSGTVYETANIAGKNTDNVIVDFGTKPTIHGDSKNPGYASYKKGGVISGKSGESKIIKAHAGEVVLPEKTVKELRKLLNKKVTVTKKVIRKKKKNAKGKFKFVKENGGIRRYFNGKESV